MRETRLQSLSSSRQRLVTLMQSIGFGEILGLAVRVGQPCFDPPPAVIREVRFGAREELSPETIRGDYALKIQILELFAQFDLLGTGVVESLEVKGGLPFRLRLRGNLVTTAPSGRTRKGSRR